jgi:hypothetical protein
MCSCPWLYSPMFWTRLAINFSRLPYWIEYGGKVYAFIDSENTYALPAKIDAARFARGRNKILGVLAKTCAGFVGIQPAEDSTARASCSRATGRRRDFKRGAK